MAGSQGHTKIVSTTPRRTRVRLSTKRRTNKEMTRIAGALEKFPFVRGVQENVKTGSLLIRHSEGSLGKLEQVLIDLGIILQSATGAEFHMAEGKARIAAGMADAVSDLDRRIGLATNGIVNLRAIVPLGLGALAVVQLLRKGWQIEATPWYVLAYAAFDSFIKLHYSREYKPVHHS